MYGAKKKEDALPPTQLRIVSDGGEGDDSGETRYSQRDRRDEQRPPVEQRPEEVGVEGGGHLDSLGCTRQMGIWMERERSFI